MYSLGDTMICESGVSICQGDNQAGGSRVLVSDVDMTGREDPSVWVGDIVNGRIEGMGEQQEVCHL